MKELILASASARRHRILADCGIEHTVYPAGIEESMGPGLSAEELVLKNAEAKAVSVAGKFSSGIVIGADTLVSCRGQVIGKPADEDAAMAVFELLLGSEAEVSTGLFVLDVETSRGSAAVDTSKLYPVRLPAPDKERYFRLLGPYDKAGGFSIEGPGGFVFDNIQGSYFNILGLPLMKLADVLKEIGVDILDYISSPGAL